MSNFMGPMAPPQAAPQTPPQMDVRTTAGQRAQFRDFMRGMSMPQILPNIGMGVPPEQPSFAPMPQNPMMNVDIFQPVRNFRYGGSTMGLGRSGQASGFSSVNPGAEQAQRQREREAQRGDDRPSPAPKPAPEPQVDLSSIPDFALERRLSSPAFGIDAGMARREMANRIGGTPLDTGFGPSVADPDIDRSGQMGGFFDYFDEKGENLNEPDIFGVAGGPYDVGSGFETVTQSQDFFNDIMRVPNMLGGLGSYIGLGPEDFKQSAIDFLMDDGGVFDPETGVLTRPEGQGTMTMNRFGNVTYSGPRSSDPFASVATGNDGPVDVMQPVAATEVNPCPPGYELRGGVCQPVAPNQIGDTATTPAPITPAPSVVVPSPRPSVGPLRGPASYQGPATFSQSATLTPEFFQNLLTPRAVGMQAGGEVLDTAAGQFLEALQAV